MRTPFRVRVIHANGDEYDLEVVGLRVFTYGDEPLHITTENGLTIAAPDEPEEEK